MSNKIFVKYAIVTIGIATIMVKNTHKSVTITDLFSMNVEALSQDDSTPIKTKYIDISDIAKPVYDFFLVDGVYRDSIISYTHTIDCKEPNEMFGTYCRSSHAEDSHEAVNKYACNLPNWFKDE